MKLLTCCGLLFWSATLALAQMHPRKKPVRQPAVARKHFSPPVSLAERELWPYLPENDPLYDGPAGGAAVFDSTRVYTYVEQMPTLNGRLGPTPISAAIQQRLVLPPAAPKGRTFVQFVVSTAGKVTQPQIVKGLRADVDSAVVAATRQLPRLTPGKQNGRVVAVRFTLVVPIGTPVVITNPIPAQASDY